MSSLAATQADGYYAPPEYYESGQYKKKSISQFAGSKGHNQYLQKGVVRFELPYDGFCQHCGEHVGKGTRFNARKTKAGNYFSTTIYKFTMTCRVCRKAEFVIHTNPKQQGFDYLEGINKQVQEFDTQEAGTVGAIDTEGNNKIVKPGMDHASTSALSRLESVASGARKVMTERDELQSLMNANQKTFFDDSASNAAIRLTFRADRKKKKKRLKDAKALGWKDGMELADETQDDVASARATCFGRGKDKERAKFRSLRKISIFDGSGKRKSRKRTRREAHVRPDDVSSLSSNIRSADSKCSGGVVKQQGSVQRKRVRLVPSGSKLERENATASRPPEMTKEPSTSTSLSSLLADYGSDSN